MGRRITISDEMICEMLKDVDAISFNNVGGGVFSAVPGDSYKVYKWKGGTSSFNTPYFLDNAKRINVYYDFVNSHDSEIFKVSIEKIKFPYFSNVSLVLPGTYVNNYLKRPLDDFYISFEHTDQSLLSKGVVVVKIIHETSFSLDEFKLKKYIGGYRTSSIESLGVHNITDFKFAKSVDDMIVFTRRIVE